MSRVFKFRIWDKANKEYMILGATGLDTRNGDVIDYYNEGNRLGGPEEYDVEQYTGLKDKNGKEIYEGDIVNIQGIKYYVDFEHGGFWFSNDNRKWKAYRPFTHFQEINDAEVIGNIHENKELWNDSEK